MDNRAILAQVTNIVWMVCRATKGDQRDLVARGGQVSQDMVTADLGTGVNGIRHNLREKKYVHTGLSALLSIRLSVYIPGNVTINRK